MFDKVRVDSLSHPKLTLPQPMQARLRVHAGQLCLFAAPKNGEKILKETEMVIALPFGRDLNIKVVRHVSNIVILSSEEQQYASQLTFSDNLSRDIFTSLVRTLIKRFNDTPDQVRLLSERDFYKKKEDLWQKQVDSLNHDLAEARLKVEEFELMEQKYQSAADLVKELSEMLERQKSRESEAVEQYSTLQ